MLPLLLMAMPVHSVTKGTLHLEDEAIETGEHIQTRYTQERERHQVPSGLELLGQCPSPAH